MNTVPVTEIAAIDKDRGIGKEGRIPWRIPEDMKFFRETTTGHVVIMGRKTYDSVGNALPNRTNIIVTRNLEYTPSNCIIVHTIKEAIEKAREIEKEEIFIIGGAQIYKEALPFTDKLMLTIIQESFECDTFFPEYKEFKTVVSEDKKEFNDIKYSHTTLTR